VRNLRLQLIGILILAALLPAIPAILTARALLEHSLDPAIAEKILDGEEAGLDATRELLDEEKASFMRRILAGEHLDTLSAGGDSTLAESERAALEAWKRMSPGVSGTSTGLRSSGRSPGQARILIPPQRLPLQGKDLLVSYAVPAGESEGVWLTTPIRPSLVEHATRLTEGMRLVQSIRLERERIVSSLLSAFLVIYGVVVVVVLLAGLLLASRLTRPLALLGDGIDRAATGDLATRIPEGGRGEVARLIGQFNEMTARLGAQQAELVRFEKLAAWRGMARRLAHEVKNPLTPIQLAAQQARDAYDGSDPAYRRLIEEVAGIIEEEVQRLRRLVAEFSEFARPPAPRYATFPVATLIADVAALYGRERVLAQPAAKPDETIRCDREQIRRALVNLIDNGIAAQRDRGMTEPIEISFSRDKEWFRISVADRGPGVPPSERRRIFEPDVTTKAEGMGLGLTIVESTAGLHGGSCEVSDREGGGAVFTLVLPAEGA
jgi:nitrogen fixation/metabolism regulation signal transduction histidine kinase